MIECPHCGFEDANNWFPKNESFIDKKENRTKDKHKYCWHCPDCGELF